MCLKYLEKPFVTISCVTYNHERYIEQALNGFLMQKTKFAFEIIVHDDASVDNTQSIIKEYEKKYPNIIKPIYQLENQLSKGISTIHSTYTFPIAQGKYIAMCDGDDYWIDPYKLQKQVDFMEENADYGLVYSSIKYYYQAENVYRIVKPKENLYDIQPFVKLLFRNQITTSSVCFRKSLLSKVDYLEIKNHKYLNGDVFLWFTLCRHTKFYLLPDLTTVYRIHNSLTNGKLSTRIKSINNSFKVRRYLFFKNKKELDLSMYLFYKLLVNWNKAIIMLTLKWILPVCLLEWRKRVLSRSNVLF